MAQVPVISVTDLYHPAEDPGDNFDLIMPYGLPEIDLKAVVLDCLEESRYRSDAGVRGFHGPRDPGVIPVTQLNAIFDADVPYGIGPFARMRTPGDRMVDAPRFQQSGIDLILRTLRESEEPVHILSFGSARTIAVAYNREPALFRKQLACLHLSAGSTAPTFLEFNVWQDPQAMIRLLNTDLPIALYPCATGEDCFSYDHHNTFYALHDLRWISGMHPKLRRYLGYAMGAVNRTDFLCALEEEMPDEVMQWSYGRRHSVWETAVWAIVAGRQIVRRAGGAHRIVRGEDVDPHDVVVRNALVACRAQSLDSGLYTFELTEQPTNFRIFVRDDPAAYEMALNEALPALYQSFRPI